MRIAASWPLGVGILSCESVSPILLNYKVTRPASATCSANGAASHKRRSIHPSWCRQHGEGSYVDGFQGGETGYMGILIDGREGAWMLWHENGQKRMEETYLNGTKTSRTEWDANGTQITR